MFYSANGRILKNNIEYFDHNFNEFQNTIDIMENMSNIEYLNGLEDTSSDSDYDIENFNSKDIIGMLYNPPNTKRTYSSTWNEWKNSQLF